MSALVSRYSVVLKTPEHVRLNPTEGNIHLGGQPLSL